MRKALLILNRPAVALWGTIGLSVFYLLSAGPVIWLIWNVRLPEWLMAVVLFIYTPLIWTVNNSEIARQVWRAYAQIWIDMNVGQPATRAGPDPVPPAYLVESAGIIISAWVIWNFVRWVNQRGIESQRPADRSTGQACRTHPD